MTAALQTFRMRVAGPQLAVGALLVVVAAVTGFAAGLNPLAGIAVAIGLAVLLVTFNDLAAGLAILVFAVFLEQVPFAGGAVTLTKMLGIVVAASWFAMASTGRAGRRGVLLTAHPGGSYILALFLGWAAISVVWANGEGFYTDLSRYLLNAVLFVIVYSAVRTRRGAGLVIGGFIAGASLTALYGIVARPVIDPSDAARLTSTIGDPNELASAMIAGVSLAVGALLGVRHLTGIRLAAGGAASIMLLAFLLTGSRGGLVGLAVALVVAVVVADRWRPRAVVAATVVAAVTAAFFAFYAPDDIRDRVLAATNGESRSQEGRDTIWVVALRMAEDRPVAGVGLASFDDEAVSYAVEPGRTFRTDEVIDNVSVAHNTYLQIWAELGLVGLALFLAVVAFSLSSAFRAALIFKRQGDLTMEVLARALLVALMGVLAADFFISQHFSKVLWLLLGLGPALLGLARAYDASDSPDPGSPTRPDRPSSST